MEDNKSLQQVLITFLAWKFIFYKNVITKNWKLDIESNIYFNEKENIIYKEEETNGN